MNRCLCFVANFAKYLHFLNLENKKYNDNNKNNNKTGVLQNLDADVWTSPTADFGSEAVVSDQGTRCHS